MAKEKKKEALSLKEKLEQALVPVDEQPYEVPENWCWVYSLKLFDIEYGKGLPTKNLTEEGYPVFGANGQIGYYSEYMYEDEKALMSCRGAYSGTMNQSLPKSYVTSNSLVIEDKGKFMLPKYICLMYEALDTSKLVSGSAQPQVTVQAFEKYPVPLPPLAEQQRIVEQIENLFAKLDEAVEKLEGVRESYLARKSAILSQAFAGRLTENWRAKNRICYTWRECKFSDVAEIKSNLVEPSEYLDYPHIAPDNIEKKTGVLLPYNTIAEDKVTSGKHRFYAGQILYSKIRPYLSKVVTVDFDGLCSADMYPIEAKENTRYLWYYMLSDEFLEQASSAGSRSVLPKINQKELSKLIVKIPEMDEQEEIVKILDKLLPLEQRVMEQTDVVLEQIALMKKSILAKVFRGELGTNNPDEESAVELLKSILM